MAINFDYDFSGWATKANVKCFDGLTIAPNAFKDCDGKVVPVVWNHDHSAPESVLGHALLQNRKEGVYAYVKLNDTSSGQTAKGPAWITVTLTPCPSTQTAFRKQAEP